MDTRKNENSAGSILFYLALAALVFVGRPRISCAETQTPAAVLTATYSLPGSISTAQAESQVVRLEESLAKCNDSYLAARIRYRMGVMYCKAHLLEKAEARFSQIADDTKCPEIIRACSLNMVGQTSRMLGRDLAALDAFNRVAAPAENRLSPNNTGTAGSVSEKLACAALTSRGEILEAAGDYKGAVAEYARLIEVLKGSKDQELLTSYGPTANDRISQLYLRQDNVDEYLKAVARLCEDYPQYYRTPVARFEAECVRFLKRLSADSQFVNGSVDAPALAIGCVKDSKKGTQGQELVSALERSCRGHPGAYGEILLQYHHAWLLDALGRKDEAIEILARIRSADVFDADDKSSKSLILQTIQDYARIQSAIMLGEKADYTEALRVLGTLGKHPEESHISVLASSVSEGLQILRREAPGNEN
jgi:tetratricopeptide (TPR) repeat protein